MNRPMKFNMSTQVSMSYKNQDFILLCSVYKQTSCFLKHKIPPNVPGIHLQLLIYNVVGSPDLQQCTQTYLLSSMMHIRVYALKAVVCSSFACRFF